jgi:hypothetical protein
MTTEGVIHNMRDPAIHEYVIGFARGNIKGEDEQGRFVEDVWCEVGRLAHDDPSLHCIAEVVWRQMIRRVPLLAVLAEGATSQEIATFAGVSRQVIDKKKKRIFKRRDAKIASRGRYYI